MISFNLTHVDGRKFQWSIADEEYTKNSSDWITAFTVRFKDGSLGHYFLSHPSKKDSVVKDVAIYVTEAGGLGAGAALGMPLGLPGMIGGMLVVYLVERFVIKHNKFDQQNEYFYYSAENGEKTFIGPVRWWRA